MLLIQPFTHHGGSLRDTSDDTTDCPLSGSLRQAPRRDVRPPAREFRWWRSCCSRRRSACMGCWRVSPGVSWTGGSSGRSGTRVTELLGQRRSSALPAVIPMATTPTTSPTTRCHKLLLGRDPSSGRGVGLAADDLSVRERCRPVRPLRAGTRAGDAGHRAASSSGWPGRRGGSRSTWTRPTTAPHGAQQLTFFNRALR